MASPLTRDNASPTLWSVQNPEDFHAPGSPQSQHPPATERYIRKLWVRCGPCESLLSGAECRGGDTQGTMKADRGAVLRRLSRRHTHLFKALVADSRARAHPTGTTAVGNVPLAPNAPTDIRFCTIRVLAAKNASETVTTIQHVYTSGGSTVHNVERFMHDT